ncbi:MULTISPECIES: DUF2956 domain-containing protein [unclassified Vibrio]|uniref:DUF2956 domain-containing protein n=1 Tax=Vibrio sp. HB236076 TaxID=3232307 RepID=A0AB39HJ51_9VIBR|nr:DUF2956 domain-containing protein [Vibrio sp. HB161653]MDP5254812.1 DUF2956 domain-containing protein [Vibrio sp. HB161653]
MKNTDKPSAQTQLEAENIAKATQKPGQTKAQTKLIAQGIEKGIALYKKQQKEKARQADKAKKKAQKHQQPLPVEPINELPTQEKSPQSTRLPWMLLILSWLGFVLYSWFGCPHF